MQHTTMGRQEPPAAYLETARALFPYNGSLVPATNFGFTRECYTKHNLLVMLSWNESAEKYDVQEATSATPPNNDRNFRRRLLSGRQSLSNRTLSTRRLQDKVAYGHLCDCVGKASSSVDFYCPSEVPYCLVDLDHPAKPGLQVYCNGETHPPFVRYLLPLSVFLAVMWIVLCFCSPKGYAARMYARKRFCRRNDELYAQALQEELTHMQQLGLRQQRIAAQIEHQFGGRRIYIPNSGNSISASRLLELATRRQQAQQHGEPGRHLIVIGNEGIMGDAEAAVGRTQQVALKTRYYGRQDRNGSGTLAKDHRDDTNHHTSTCSICLVDFVRGDRVGDLHCGHVFHSECLKCWIQRRHDHCPLCKATNLTVVATKESIVTSNPGN